MILYFSLFFDFRDMLYKHKIIVKVRLREVCISKFFKKRNAIFEARDFKMFFLRR